MNVEDKKSLDHRLSVPKYVRDAAIVERDSQQRVFTAQTDRDKKQTIVRDEHGAEIARFSWSTWSGSAKIKLPMGKEERCVEWMPRPGTEIKITGSKTRMLRHNGFPYVWIARGDVDIVESVQRPGLALAILSRAEGNRIELEVFHDAIEILGFLQTLTLSTIYMKVEEPL